MQVDIGQLFFIGLEGGTLTSKEIDFIVKNNIGGVTLFGRNIKSMEQVHKLCTDIYNLKDRLASKTPLIIGIDMEGGRVHRLKEGFTQWPSLGKVAELNSTTLAFKFAQTMGLELHALGIHLNYSPCVDILTNEKNVLIGDRSLGTEPETVARLGSSILRGYIKAGIIPCAKHFPGHGNTTVDSHEDLPIEATDLETLRQRELIPFKKAIRARLDLIMTAHILYKNIDPDLPATLSKKIITDLLRKELCYSKLIISDDLDMKALTKNYPREEIPVLALEAGCDTMLYCNEFDSPAIGLEAVHKAIEDKKIPLPQVKESLQRMERLKEQYLGNRKCLDFKEATAIITNPRHRALAEAIRKGQLPPELKT